MGRWFKRFTGMTVCGEGELVKTFLRQAQAASGRNSPDSTTAPRKNTTVASEPVNNSQITADAAARRHRSRRLAILRTRSKPPRNDRYRARDPQKGAYYPPLQRVGCKLVSPLHAGNRLLRATRLVSVDFIHAELDVGNAGVLVSGSTIDVGDFQHQMALLTRR